MLLERLIGLQKALGLSDRKFAKLLGVNDGLWTNTRLGKTPIRFTVLTGAVRAFPENEALRQDVIEYLGEAKTQTEAVA